MNDFTDTETLSTTIDTDPSPSAGGGGQVVEPSEPASLRSDLETVFREEAEKPEPKEPAKSEQQDELEESKDDEAEKPAPKTEDKAEEKPAPKRDEGGKFARAEGKEEAKEERRFVEAPQSFMPKAKEVWRNTPHAVQAEVARMVEEHTQASERVREQVERYETLRPYEELARSNGRDLRDSLDKMAQVETLLQQNPLAGLNAILMEIGPRKQDGQPYSLYEVAQFITQQEPAQYQQMVARPPEPAKDDPRIAQLQQELARVQEQTAQQTIVEPFRAAHPRFDELERDIAFFLSSGRIPESLSPTAKLEAAYDMAERINPPSHAPASDDRGSPANDRRADEGFSGSRSIKSSPGSVTETYEPEAKGGESVRDSLRAEMRRLNRA